MEQPRHKLSSTDDQRTFFVPPQRVSRRIFLRGVGTALALPMLEAMNPVFAAAPQTRQGPARAPRRMVTICTALGLHAPFFFPEQTGADYPVSPYLAPLAGLRDQFTVFSGLSHPGVGNGHASESSFLTAAPRPGEANFSNTISLDQFAMTHVGSATRLPYLALGTSEFSLSWTRNGVHIPAESSASRLFARLFLDGAADEVQRQIERVKEGQTILDSVREETRQLERGLGRRDLEKLDQYFTSVRELEQRLARREYWARQPKPRVAVPQPADVTDAADVIRRTQLMYDLIHLALQTDSTRVITLHLAGTFSVVPIKGVTLNWHGLSHHGKDPARIEQLKLIELQEMALLASLLEKLKQTPEQNGTLLDQTMVLFGSNLGNASSHDTKNLPMLLAGGGFRHEQHLRFNPDHNTPLCNLFVSMLQQLGVETDSFASGRRTLNGLSARS